MSSEYFSLNDGLSMAKAVAEVSQFIEKEKKNNPNLDFLSTNPLNEYLNRPKLGYVKSNMGVRHHGGVPGMTQTGEPDYILLPVDWLNNFAVSDLRDLALNESRYRVVKKIKLETSVVKIYIYKKIN
jgi:hypothetical protein